MIIKCVCCGVERDFEDGEAAFQAGWDAPPHFSHTSCDLCPGVCAIGMDTHHKAHAHWKEHGRPATFEVDTCAGDSIFGDTVKVMENEAAMVRLREILEKAKGKKP